MALVTIKIYRYVGLHRKRELTPDSLLKTISVECESAKPLNKERAKRLLSRTFPERGKPWFIWEYERGWLDLIKYEGAKAWALVCHEEHQ